MAPGDTGRTQLQAGLRQFGVGEDAADLATDITRATNAKLGAIEYIEDPKKSLTLQLSHWNKSPCSYARKMHDKKQFQATVIYRLTRYTFMPDGSTVTTEGPKATSMIDLWAPVPGSIRDEKPQIACACTIVKEGTEFGLLRDEHGKETGVACTHEGTTKLLGGAELKDIALNFEGHGMNRFTVSAKNKPPHCERITIPAGFEYICADGSAQDVLQVQDMTLEFPGGSNVGYIASIDPYRDFVGWLVAQTDVRTLCLNMTKPAPSPGKSFFLSMPRDPGTLRLARLTRDSRFNGPWDQVRLWLYTDRASIDEMAKVLIPRPSPRIYLRELHTLVKEQFIDLDPEADAKMVDNRLLVGAMPDLEALRWFVGWKLQHQREATLKFLRSSGKTLAEHFKDGKPEDAAAGIAALASALVAYGKDEGAATALDILNDAALKPHTDTIMRDKETAAVFTRLTETTDATLAARLLDLAERHPQRAAWACLNVNEALPAAVRDRAAKVAAKG
jgi:hypothetical protein